MVSNQRPSAQAIMYLLGGALLLVGGVICSVALRNTLPTVGGFGFVLSVVGYLLVRIVRGSKLVTGGIIILWLALVIGLASL